MAVLEILKYPHPLLKKRSKEVEQVDVVGGHPAGRDLNDQSVDRVQGGGHEAHRGVEQHRSDGAGQRDRERHDIQHEVDPHLFGISHQVSLNPSL